MFINRERYEQVTVQENHVPSGEDHFEAGISNWIADPRHTLDLNYSRTIQAHLTFLGKRKTP